MQLKKLIVAVALSASAVVSQAQNIDVKWSEKIKYNKKTGYFDGFIGANEKYVYARYSSGSKKIRFAAHDKTTMKEVVNIPIIGYVENESSKDKMKDLKFFDQIVFEHSDLEYAVFDYKTGAFNKQKYVLNKPNAKSDDKRYVEAANIDNQFFTRSLNTKFKLSALWGCFCPYLFFIPGFTTSSSGCLGTVVPVSKIKSNNILTKKALLIPISKAFLVNYD